MWKRTCSKTFKDVSKSHVWRILTDINNWPQWHGDLEACHIQGKFEVGNHFRLKPKGMKAVKIMLTEVDEGKSFTDCTSFPGAKMFDTHAMEETPEGLKLTNTLVVTGPLKWLWIKLVAQHVANTISDEMDALINLARRTYG